MTLPWTSGLPEDLSTNTFHFFTASDPASAGERTAILDALVSFYNFSSGVAGDDLAGFMGDIVSRVANACSIDLYDLGDAEPRVPVETRTFTLGAADSATTAPTELALCLSFQAAPTSGIPQARRRGRVFTGPFNTGVIAGAGRPAATLRASVAAAGNFLLDTLNNPASVAWGVWSRVDSAMYLIDDGWCDDEWDILRSRGRRPTTRTTFT